MATTGNLWNKSNKVGTSTGEKWVEACPISTLNSALNNTSYVPTNAKITGLKLHVKADFDLGMIFGNVYLRYGWGGTSSINKELLSSSKMTSTNELEYPSGGVDIYSYLKSVYSPFSLKTDNGSYLAFAFSSANVTTKTYKITSVTLEITYEIHNHSYTTVVSKTAATCLAAGSIKKQCSCGATTTETIAKLSHSYTGAIKNNSNSKTGTHSYKCVNGCNNYGGAVAHTWNSGVQTTAPTCTTNGVKTYTCTASGCGGTYTESIAALGHSYNSVVTPPTETAQGYTTHTCSRCGHSYVDSYVEPIKVNKILIDTTKPKKIFIDNQEVKKIYIDTTKVYG